MATVSRASCRSDSRQGELPADAIGVRLDQRREVGERMDDPLSLGSPRRVVSVCHRSDLLLSFGSAPVAVERCSFFGVGPPVGPLGPATGRAGPSGPALTCDYVGRADSVMVQDICKA